MYLEQFQYFIEVANTKSMSSASINLHVTQQNISKSIKQLETELEAQLFQRTPNGVFLTETGQKVYVDILAILTQINSLKQKYSHPACIVTAPGSLTFLSIYGLAHLHIQLSKMILDKFPNYSFDIYETSVSICNKQLLSNKENCEIIITQTNDIDEFFTPEIMSSHHAFLVKSDRLRLQASKHSPVAEQNNISMNALTYLPLVTYCSKGETPYFIDVLRKHHVNPKSFITTNNLLTSQSYINSGIAYGLTTKYVYLNLAQSFIENTTLVPIKEKIEIHYLIFVHKFNFKSADCNEHIIHLLEQMYSKLF